MNYFLMFIGQVFEVLGFFLALPSCICNSLAQVFYLEGSINNQENDEN